MAVIVLQGTVTTTLPSAPLLTVAQPYNGAAGVTWAPRGVDIAGFIVTAAATATEPASDVFTDTFTDVFGDPGSSPAPTVTVNASAVAASVIVDGLVNGVEYAVSVVTRAGSGLLSAPSLILLVTPSALLSRPGDSEVDPPPVTPQLPGPLMQAFPVERVFHPGNWLLTQEEADARG